MKFILLIIASILSNAAMATVLYSHPHGAWNLTAITGDDKVCLLDTTGTDGKIIRVNVYPYGDGQQNVTMTVTDPDWNMALSNKIFPVKFLFTSSKYGTDVLDGQAQVKGPNTIIFRQMSKAFSKDTIHYDTLTLFPDTSNLTVIDLSGTNDLVKDLAQCTKDVLL